MKVVGLDGKIYYWQIYKNNYQENKSTYHIKAIKVIKDLFPLENIIEEIYLPGTNNLRLDFYLKIHKTAIEVQGEQHYKFIPFFHKNIFEYLNSQKRDKDKELWCYLNKITLIKLDYREINEWKQRIIENIKTSR